MIGDVRRCQLCSKIAPCEMILCDTSHLYEKDRKLTGKRGQSRLRICKACSEKWRSK